LKSSEIERVELHHFIQDAFQVW